MPRPIRPDLRPIILIPDTSDAQRRARNVVSPRLGVSVYQLGTTAPYIRWHASFYDWINFLRSEGETIDHEILNYMVGRVSFADARSQGPANDNGLVPHILFMPGCRVELTQQEIANELGCSTERVRLAIKQLEICGVIVNSGKGWYEFDANHVWKGKEDIRQAYIPVQNNFTRIFVFKS